jgi:hypothetical protein
MDFAMTIFGMILCLLAICAIIFYAEHKHVTDLRIPNTRLNAHRVTPDFRNKEDVQ